MVVFTIAVLEEEKHDVEENFALIALMILADLWCFVDVIQAELERGKEAHELREAKLFLQLYLLVHRVAIAVRLAPVRNQLKLSDAGLAQPPIAPLLGRF